MNGYDMCQFNKESICPNIVLLGENVASIKQYIKEMKETAIAAQIETRTEISDLRASPIRIHKRIDALIYWVAGLSITNLLAIFAVAAQFIVRMK